MRAPVVSLCAAACVAFAASSQASPRAHRTSSPLRTAQPAFTPLVTGNVTYQGGPIISHVEVVVVLWGTNVASLVTDNVASFYTAVTNSPLLDWMGEYDTARQPNGTNQHVFHGEYVETVTIMPSKTSGTIADSDIQAELQSNIKSGVLPMPQADPVEGHVNTLYAVYFPPGVSIDDGSGSLSCTKWCAYHGSFTYSGLSSGVPYSVIPDFSNSGCSTGCGGTTPTEGMTCTSAHEMLEAISDTDDNATAWYDNSQGEICDICTNCVTVAGFSVQECWSQRLKTCIATDPSLPLCDGTTRPCRSCTPPDCSGATPVCVTDPLAPNAGECVAGSPADAGSGSSGSGGSRGSSGGSSGSTSGSSGGGGSGGASSGSGSSTSGGGSSTGSGAARPDAGGGDTSFGGGNDDLHASDSGGCACTSRPGGAPSRVATLTGLLFGVTAVARRRRTRQSSGRRRLR